MIMLSSPQNTIRRASHRQRPGMGPMFLSILFLSLLLTGCGEQAQTAKPATGPVTAAFDAASIAGLTALEQDQFAMAEKQFSLALKETASWPPADARIPQTLINLGTALTLLQRNDEADAAFERGLQLAQAHHTDDRDLRGDLEFRRADLYRHKGDPDAADTWYQRAETTLAASATHPFALQAKVAHGRGLVALVLRNQPAAAQPHFQHSMEFMEQAKLAETADYCTLLNNYASCYLAQANVTQAAPLLSHAWKLEQAQFPDLRATAETAYLQGKVAFFEKKYDTAETMFQKALDFFSKNLGPGSSPAVHAQSDLADTQMAAGRKDAAIQTYEACIASLLARTTEGTPEDRQNTAVIMGKLGKLYIQDGKFEPALAVVEKLQAFYEKYGAGESPALAELLTVKSNLLRKLERVSDADVAAARANEIRAKNTPAPK